MRRDRKEHAGDCDQVERLAVGHQRRRRDRKDHAGDCDTAYVAVEIDHDKVATGKSTQGIATSTGMVASGPLPQPWGVATGKTTQGIATSCF